MSPTFIIFKKELRDMFRDKRVRMTAVITPVIMMFIFMYLFGFLEQTVAKRQNIKIHVIQGSAFITELLVGNHYNVTSVASVADAERMVKSGQAQLVLQSSSAETAKEAKQVLVRAFYDPKQELSKLTLSQVKDLFAQQNKLTVKRLLMQKGLPETAAEPFKLETQEVQVGGKTETSELLVGLLPYLAILWAFLGGVSIATELVAGEKEKNTLETLLISPVSRSQIAYGKWLSLATICLLSSAMTFIGLFLVQALGLPATKALFPHGLGISAATGLIIIAILIPMVAFFASLLLAVSTYAKNTREAQGYLAGINFVIIMPAMMSQFIGFTEYANSQWLYVIPVLNTATIIRQVLQAKIDPTGVAITVAISLILALIAMRISIKLFTREQVLTRV